MNGETKLARIK